MRSNLSVFMLIRSVVFRSDRFRLGAVFLSLVLLVGLSAYTGFQIIAARDATDPLIDVANAQSIAAYRLATLARKLSANPGGTESTTVLALLDDGIASFDANQRVLFTGDAARGIPAVTNNQALEALTRADNQWKRYRELLVRYKTSPEQTDLLPQIDTQATSVFVFTTEFADALELLVNRAFGSAEQVFILVAFSTLVVLILSMLLLSQIVRALRRLIMAAQSYALGHYDVRTGRQRLNEFAEVANVLQNMATSVANREIELKELNQVLEKRVEERTDDLLKARDEALIASQKAQESDRLKSEFLSTMSHELRTPLNAIEGFTSIMLSNMGIDLPSRAKTMIERVSANSKRLLGLINDFLDLSRIESGRLELVKTPIDVDTLLKRWVNQVTVLAEQKKLDFEAELESTVPSTILGDEEALSKIVINLLGNAFKFTPEGSVHLRVGMTDPRHFNIVVSDTGIGIPPHAREFIFEEFRQVDGTSKRKYGGTGLGLAIVQKLARAMGGNVTLQSELGIGSTFIVTLPLENATVTS